MTASVSNSAEAIGHTNAMAFSGKGSEFFGLLFKGSLLQIPTFGFYRFWLITKMRRHMWSNTHVEGESFEYTGTAKELLLGFLMALAILVPVYILYFLATTALGEKKALAAIPLVLFMYVLGHFVAYRSRRYRATRTTFRGIRFWMSGSAVVYALRAIAWDVLTIITLGLALPWAVASLERYRMRHTHFGSLQGDFTSSGWTLFKRAGWIWAFAPVFIAITILIRKLVKSAQISEFIAIMNPENTSNWMYLSLSPTTVKFLGFGILGILGLATLFLIPVFLSIYTRWQVEGLCIGEAKLSSKLGKRAFIAPYLRLIFSVFGMIIIFALMVVGYALVFGEAIEAAKNGLFSGQVYLAYALAAIFYLVFLITLSILKRYFMVRGLWKVIATSITVTNLSALNSASAAGIVSSSIGEGLADALDIGAGF